MKKEENVSEPIVMQGFRIDYYSTAGITSPFELFAIKEIGKRIKRLVSLPGEKNQYYYIITLKQSELLEVLQGRSLYTEPFRLKTIDYTELT